MVVDDDDHHPTTTSKNNSDDNSNAVLVVVGSSDDRPKKEEAPPEEAGCDSNNNNNNHTKSMDDQDQEAETSRRNKNWTDTELENARSVKESMDSVNAFCGLMAGFEGFIINEYVNSNGNSGEVPFDSEGTFMWQEPFTNTFKWGLFFLIISFSLNLAAAMTSFLWGVFIREGMYRQWFMTTVGRATKLMATAGTFTFVIGVLLFIETIGIGKQFTIPIYILATILFTSILCTFVYTLVEVVPNEPERKWKAVMERVNG